jgi:ribosomal protein S18 acetylase RimI-like enzyme
MTTQTEFTIATADDFEITDREIAELLTKVYVEGGFTPREEAISLFEPSAVRKRGTIIGALHKPSTKLSGFIIMVPHDSPASKFAGENEGEVHLLGVMPEYRGHGVGRRMIEVCIERSHQLGLSKLILWTQITMKSAQVLYEAAGFHHINDFERNGRKYKMYDRDLST